MSDYLPCPFCGSDRISQEMTRDGRTLGCFDCGAKVTAFNPNALAECTALWNRRTKGDVAMNLLIDAVLEIASDGVVDRRTAQEIYNEKRRRSEPATKPS